MSPIEVTKTAYQTVAAKIAKPDHPFWRKFANWMVIVGEPVGTTVIQVAVPAPFKMLATIAWSLLIGTLKFASKLTVDPKAK